MTILKPKVSTIRSTRDGDYHDLLLVAVTISIPAEDNGPRERDEIIAAIENLEISVNE